MITSTRNSRLLFRYLDDAFVRSKSSSPAKPKDKKATADAIKRLNKENKHLFGELLDRPKSKSQSKLTQEKKAGSAASKAPRNDGIEFEAKRYKRTCNGVSCSLTEVTSATPSEEIQNTVSIEKSSTPRVPQVKLPEIIVRNIPTFPLLNENKLSDSLTEETGIVMNISRENKDFLPYPSVTRILDATMSEASKAALAWWKKKMIAELGEEKFEEYQRNLLHHGSQFHSTIESYLMGRYDTDLDLLPEMEGCWNSLSTVIPELDKVRVVESHVSHSKLMYRGVIDCVANYKGQPVVIEWKKSDKPKPELKDTYDAPLQMSAYLGAMNFDENYRFQVQAGVVVVAYTNGAPATVFRVSPSECQRYWRLWLQRLHSYWLMQGKPTHTKIASMYVGSNNAIEFIQRQHKLTVSR